MVNDYKRKTDNQSWLEKDMKKAIKKVTTHKLGVSKAAFTYNVPKTTLLRRLAKYKTTKDLNEAAKKKMGHYVRVFNVAQEKELASYVKDMETSSVGLTEYDFRKMAYELAEKNQLQHSFCRRKKIAGKLWLQKFLERNPDLILRVTEPNSEARVSCFNQVVVSQPQPSLSAFFISPEDIMPIPKTSKVKKKTAKQKNTVELTSSSYGHELESNKETQELEQRAKKPNLYQFTEKEHKRKGKGKGKSTKTC